MATRKGYRTSTTEPVHEVVEPRITRRRIAAVVAAAGGWYTTWLFVSAVGIIGIPGFAVSVIVEWLLFEFKREVLATGARLTIGGIVAVLADTLLNGGGMWSVVLGLNNTDTYAMFAGGMRSAATATTTATVAASAAGTNMPMLPYLVIALVLGFVLAIAPHKLWHRQ
jgi:hypothetical protein